jgi:hypothetical protein
MDQHINTQTPEAKTAFEAYIDDFAFYMKKYLDDNPFASQKEIMKLREDILKSVVESEARVEKQEEVVSDKDEHAKQLRKLEKLMAEDD